MRSLVIEKKLRRLISAKLLSEASLKRSIEFGPLALRDLDPPRLPNERWVRIKPLLSGICGSDLATVLAKTSRYFEPLVSFPFTPGHEIVGTTGEDQSRVVIESALTCIPRGQAPCRHCTAGETQLCEGVILGDVKKGIQIGYCSSTSGGWAQELVAHKSQLWDVPDTLSDEDAVLIEPLACALHAVGRTPLVDRKRVAIVGAGTVGLLVLAGIKYLYPQCEVTIAAKHSLQRQSAERLGAHEVIPPNELQRSSRRTSSAMKAGSWISSGYDVIFDCVGTSNSIEESIKATAPKGSTVLVGMPGMTHVDLTSLWHRETSISGAYAYGQETIDNDIVDDLGLSDLKSIRRSENTSTMRTFDLAIRAMESLHLGWMVTHGYSLDNYTSAIEKAASAGTEGAIKVVFDLRKRPSRRTVKGNNDL